ncbi:hypothetical protein BGZ91_003100 [Linnemannia elongata]|nr:hypothetical protein BGZ91_003100 [Linnemannia elongata]
MALSRTCVDPVLMQLYVPPDFHALLVNRSPLSIVEIRVFGKQLVAGLSYIHKAGIRHCDLKPENVLVDRDMQLKIIDFGLSEELFFRSDWTAGMPGYWASEVLKGKVHADKIDEKPEKRTSERYQPATSAPTVINVEKASCGIPHIEVFRDRKTGVQHLDARVEPIAEGNFGTVYEVIDREGCKAALKVPKPTANLKMVKREADFLNDVQGHRNGAMFYGEVDGVRSHFLLLELYQPRDFFALEANRGFTSQNAQNGRKYDRKRGTPLAHKSWN